MVQMQTLKGRFTKFGIGFKNLNHKASSLKRLSESQIVELHAWVGSALKLRSSRIIDERKLDLDVITRLQAGCTALGLASNLISVGVRVCHA